jgi:hypothetical protein
MMCAAFTLPTTYKLTSTRCEKPGRVKVGGKWVCRPHRDEHARKGDAIFSPKEAQ